MYSEIVIAPSVYIYISIILSHISFHGFHVIYSIVLFIRVVGFFIHDPKEEVNFSFWIVIKNNYKVKVTSKKKRKK